MSKKNIMPENEDGRYHGYIEKYDDDGELYWKGVCVHGIEYGYHEWHSDGSMGGLFAGYFLDDNKISDDNVDGYCYVWNRVAV